MTELERNALMGNAVAQKECTEKGILLPCPFCGGTGIDQGVVSSGILKGSYYFQCEDCGCEITVNASEHLLSAWNTRAAPPIGRCGECLKKSLCSIYRDTKDDAGFCNCFVLEEREENAVDRR